jgi:hypothetical protein
MSWRLIGWSSAVGAAALGAWLYVAAPGVGTYWLSFFLILPLGLAVCGVLRNRLPVPVQWAGAALLAAGGVVGYLLWPNAGWWNFGQLAALPVAVMIIQRGTSEGAGDGLGGMGDGPWGPP